MFLNSLVCLSILFIIIIVAVAVAAVDNNVFRVVFYNVVKFIS